MSWQEEAMKLRVENDRLKEENAFLRSAIGDGVMFPPEWRLTETESIVLGAIYGRKVGTCRRETIDDALSFRRPSERESNIVSVYVTRLRNRLRAFIAGPTIITDWGVGYYLSDDLRGAIDDFQQRLKDVA